MQPRPRSGIARLFALASLASALAAVACGSDDDSGAGGSTTLGPTCQSNDDCPGGEPFCAGGRCVECLETANCDSATEVCDAPSGSCLEGCSAPDAACDGNRMCSVERGACVNCLTNADCDGGQPYCVAELDGCQECRNSIDCGGRDCRSGSCVECNDNTDCPNDEPHCDVADNECHECLSDAHCAPGQFCDGNDCEALCTSDPSVCGADEVCEPNSAQCVECVTDADCPADNPGCIDFECQECSLDEHCTAPEVCDVADGQCG